MTNFINNRRAAPLRRGISLIEVLISMFVLLFGLMGVAAIFPVGNHYAARSEQFDRGSALAQSAFADLKARGMLDPKHWYYASQPDGDTIGGPVYGVIANEMFRVPIDTSDRDNPQPGYAFVIDPMGAGLGLYGTPPVTTNLDSFPYASLIDAGTPDGAPNTQMPDAWRVTATKMGLYGLHWPVRRVSLLQSPSTLLNPRVAETIFRLHDDVTNEQPRESDRPAIQRWSADYNGFPQDEPWNHRLLARSYSGNYSWLATVVPTTAESLAALQPINPRFGSDLYEVSVAVFNKREPLPPSAATERLIEAEMLQGNELVIFGKASSPEQAAENLNNATEGIRPGQWIAVTGVHPTNGSFLLKWYRILSIDDETQENQPLATVAGNYPVRRAMLDGPDWPLTNIGGGVRAAPDLRAIILPGVISVSTQMLPMEAAQ